MTPSDKTSEDMIVNAIINHLEEMGFVVAKEVANFYRSADIAAISPFGLVWIIEGKLSNMKHAVKQLEIHKQSADRVFIGTPLRKLKKSTKDMIDKKGIGLIFVDKNLKVEVIPHDKTHMPWDPSREILISRIRELSV